MKISSYLATPKPPLRPAVADPLETPSHNMEGRGLDEPAFPSPTEYPYETVPRLQDPLETGWGFGCFENHFNSLIADAVQERWSDASEPLDPLLFKAVIAAESAFDPVARSRTGATGLVQLTSGTARAFGLSLSPVDERLMPEKAVPVGVAVLDEKHRVLKNPPLSTDYGRTVARAYEEIGRPSAAQQRTFALAGYNGGASTVLRAMAKAIERGVDFRDWEVLTSAPEGGGKAPLLEAVEEVYGSGSANSKFREMSHYPGRVMRYMNRAESPLQGLKIMVDPGHGGTDPGAIGPTGKREADVNLGVSLKLRDKLRALGAEVRVTRETDRNVGRPGAPQREELAARVALANSWPAELFISVHCNSAANPAAHGTEVYVARESSRASQDVAREVHRDMVDQTGLQGRGVKRANFHVIRHTHMPAILVETAFISNPTEEALLADNDFQHTLADSIASGVQKYAQTHHNQPEEPQQWNIA